MQTTTSKLTPFVPADVLERFYVCEPYDTRFSACARLLSSVWREQQGLPFGTIKPKKGRRRSLGSRLAPEAARAGFNYLTPDIARLVRREAAYRQQGALMDVERLWGNLLSSAPLTFNLLGHAKVDAAFGERLFRALLPDFVASVDDIQFEFSPGRGDVTFTGDHSAFDVFVKVTTIEGKKGFIAIEIKYAESMRYVPRQMRERVNQLAEQSGLYENPRAPELRDVPIEQFFRQHLLAHSMIGKASPYTEGLFVVIAPDANLDVQRAIVSYRRHLRDEAAGVKFRSLSLEKVISEIASAGEPKLSADLTDRYLNFNPIHNLIEDWEPHKL